MQEKILRNAPRNLPWCQSVVIVAASVALSATASAQNLSKAAPSGASGMTTGSSSTTGNQMKLMQIRAQAYQAKKDTEAASLARSTDRALEDRNLSSAVEKSRQIKQIKQEAARKMEFEKSSQAYNKVSSNDISRWTDQRGNIKVQRDAPVFNNSLGEPPAGAVNPSTLDRNDAEPLEEERSGFSPFKGAGNAVKKIGGMNPFKKKEEEIGLRVPEVDLTKPSKKEKKGFLSNMPFGKKDKVQQNLLAPQEPVAPVEKEKKGFLKGIGQNLPLIGKKNKDEVIIAPSTPAQPTTAPQAPVAPTAPTSPVRVQGSTMVNGIARVPNTNNVVSPPAPANYDSVATPPTSNVVSNPAITVPPVIEEKPGFMGRLRNAGDKINPFSKNDDPEFATTAGGQAGVAVEEEKTGFLSKLRKDDNQAQPTATAPAAVVAADKPGIMDRFRGIGGNSAQGNRVGGSGTIDASLFPDGSTSATPMGGPLTASTPATPAATTSGPTGEFAAAPTPELPGQEKKGFKLPTISVPDFSEVGKPDPTVPKVWKERTTQHKGGSNFYVVSAATNFMKFGGGQFNSEVSELAAGTIVKMTKPGDEWSSIQLQNGSSGIVKNKSLRPAQTAEIPSSFGTAPAPASISAN